MASLQTTEILAGIGRGISQGIQNYMTVQAKRQEMNDAKKRADIDYKIKKLQLEEAQQNMDPDIWKFKKEELELDKKQKEANIKLIEARTSALLKDAENKVKNGLKMADRFSIATKFARAAAGKYANEPLSTFELQKGFIQLQNLEERLGQEGRFRGLAGLGSLPETQKTLLETTPGQYRGMMGIPETEPLTEPEIPISERMPKELAKIIKKAKKDLPATAPETVIAETEKDFSGLF